MAVNQHSSEVIQEITNDVLRIVISRPEKRNPLGSSTAKALVDALKRADQDNDIRVIVLTGAGDAFSAGGNLKEFVELFEGSASEIWEDGATWHDLYGCIRKLGKPVIARVDGPCNCRWMWPGLLLRFCDRVRKGDLRTAGNYDRFVCSFYFTAPT